MAFLGLISCDKNSVPILSQDVKARAVTNHIIFTRSYEIPQGIFRGTLWPTKDRSTFQVWIIESGKELFFDITPPSEFANYEKEVTKNWEIKKTDLRDDTVIYLAERKDRKKAIKVELPVKKRTYSFSVLKNDEGKEMLIFMDISEDVIDKGLFGYVIIK